MECSTLQAATVVLICFSIQVTENDLTNYLMKLLMTRVSALLSYQPLILHVSPIMWGSHLSDSCIVHNNINTTVSVITNLLQSNDSNYILQQLVQTAITHVLPPECLMLLQILRSTDKNIIMIQMVRLKRLMLIS